MKPVIATLAATLLVLSATNPAPAMQQGTEEKPGKAKLKAGEYIWDEKAAPSGPLDIIVNLKSQQLFVYRDGVRIGRSTISSGSKGRETPTGVYMILHKDVTHHSNKYHEASMPFMERLTWGGLAIHAGNNPGYPESHGCMHVPLEFAKKLYGLTDEGNSVLVTDGNTKPEPTPDLGLLFAEPSGPAAPDASPAPGGTPPADASPAPSPGGTPAFTWKPEDAKNGPYLIVFSTADKRIYVYRKGVEFGRADLGGADAGKSQGKHVYAALDKKGPDGGPAWALLGSGDGAHAPDFKDLAKGWTMPPGFLQKVRGIIAPGTTVVITDAAADNTKPKDSKEEG